ncbi:putative MFS transporter [Sarocladium strictum]
MSLTVQAHGTPASTHSPPSALATRVPLSIHIDLPNSDNVSKYELSRWRRYMTLFVISWMTLVITWSSTSLFIATDEIAHEFHTTPTTLNIMNSAVLVLTGLSSLIWVPLGRIWGRKSSYIAATILILGASIGTALAHNFATFTAMRLLTGLPGTYFMVAGQTILTDIFPPTKRGRANGLFMTGSVSGPALGPCISGIIITFTNWRVIYWVQTGMVCLGLVLSVLFIASLPSKNDECLRVYTPGCTLGSCLLKLALIFDPRTTFRQFLVPRILLAHLVCGFLAVTQFGLLASIRYIITPRFNLSTPLVAGLFYIAPGAGFIAGSIFGGQLSDRTVKRYIVKRDGLRIPEDRLNSGLIGLFAIMPIGMLIFGWTLQQKVASLALLLVSAFWIGAGLMGTFNGLNTYAAEVLPAQRSEVIGAKYLMQYAFGATSSAAVIPLIQAVGVGRASGHRWRHVCIDRCEVLES